MGSRIIGSIGWMKKIIQIDKTQITFSYLMYVEANSLSWLLEKVSLCPEVIPISGFPCISTEINDLCLPSQTNSNQLSNVTPSSQML